MFGILYIYDNVYSMSRHFLNKAFPVKIGVDIVNKGDLVWITHTIQHEIKMMAVSFVHKPTTKIRNTNAIRCLVILVLVSTVCS